MTQKLPANANFEQQRKRAKTLLKHHANGDISCCEVLKYHERFSSYSDTQILAADIVLADVQHALSRSYGFKNWHELKVHITAKSYWDYLLDEHHIKSWGPSPISLSDSIFDSANKGWVGFDQPFRDFILECEFLFEHDGIGQGAILLRGDRDSAAPHLSGYELDIDGASEKHGHIHFPCYPQPYKGDMCFERGKWQQVRVEAKGTLFTISLNEKKGIQFEDDRFKFGQICLQGSPLGVKYRNLRIHSLDTNMVLGSRTPWTTLFNGRTASDWQTNKGSVLEFTNESIRIEPGPESMIIWKGGSLTPGTTLEFSVWRHGDSSDGHYDFILMGDTTDPKSTGISFKCYKDHVKVFAKEKSLTTVHENLPTFEPTPWPEQWRFVLNESQIQCERFGERVLTINDLKLSSGGVAIETLGDNLEIRRIDQRCYHK